MHELVVSHSQCSCCPSVGSGSTGAKQCMSNLQSPESCTAYLFLLPCLATQAVLHMLRTMTTDRQTQLHIERRVMVYACAGAQISTCAAHIQHTRDHHSGIRDHTALNFEYRDACMAGTMAAKFQLQLLHIECMLLVCACAGTQHGKSAALAQHTLALHFGTRDHTALNFKYVDAPISRNMAANIHLQLLRIACMEMVCACQFVAEAYSCCATMAEQ